MWAYQAFAFSALTILPSTFKLPLDGDIRPVSRSISVLLPLPVVPLNPTLEPSMILTFALLRTGVLPALYLNEASSNQIWRVNVVDGAVFC